VLRDEGVHGRFLPVHQERALGIDAAPPSQKLSLIGTSGESVDGVNAGAHPDRLARNRDFRGAVEIWRASVPYAALVAQVVEHPSHPSPCQIPP
jgi:hypothetical protein